jgi:hypothetical protein
MVVHTYNASTEKAEAGRWRVQGQPGLHSQTLSQKKKKKVKMVYFLLCIFYILNSEEGLGQWRIKLYYVR